MNDLARPPMAAHTGYRLIKLGEALLDRAEQVLAPLGVRARHLNVLVTLRHLPDLSQQELSRILGIDVNSMVVVIDLLEREGLAVRERNPRDRRRHVIRVTDRGLDLVDRGQQLLATAEAEFFLALTEDEQVTLRTLCGRLLGLADPPPTT